MCVCVVVCVCVYSFAMIFELKERACSTVNQGSASGWTLKSCVAMCRVFEGTGLQVNCWYESRRR